MVILRNEALAAKSHRARRFRRLFPLPASQSRKLNETPRPCPAVEATGNVPCWHLLPHVRLSLFSIRKHLAQPAVLLLALFVVFPASPHVAQGLALCIGSDGHTAVTPAPHSSGHSNAPRQQDRTAQETASAPASALAGAEEAEEHGGRCIDVALTGTNDPCTSAVQLETPDAEVALASGSISIGALGAKDEASASVQLPRPLHSAASFSSQDRPVGTVVLLV